MIPACDRYVAIAITALCYALREQKIWSKKLLMLSSMFGAERPNFARSRKGIFKVVD